MTDAKDELFCRLALRQGLFTKEEAVGVIKAYRTEAKVGQDIGAFVMQEGWLEEPVVRQIESAIAQRAPGHVSKARRRVPGKGGVATRSTKRIRHHDSSPAKVAANPAQIAMVSVAGIVLIGCLILVVFKLQGGERTRPTDAIKTDEERQQERAAARMEAKKREEAKKKAEVVVEAPRVLTEEEKKQLAKRVNDAKMAAYQGVEQSPYRALEGLKKRVAALEGEQLSPELQAVLAEAEQEVSVFLLDKYTELSEQLQAAKDKGDDTLVGHILEDIADQCGPEYRKKAEQ